MLCLSAPTAVVLVAYASQSRWWHCKLSLREMQPSHKAPCILPATPPSISLLSGTSATWLNSACLQCIQCKHIRSRVPTTTQPRAVRTAILHRLDV